MEKRRVREVAWCETRGGRGGEGGRKRSFHHHSGTQECNCVNTQNDFEHPVPPPSVGGAAVPPPFSSPFWWCCLPPPWAGAAFSPSFVGWVLLRLIAPCGCWPAFASFGWCCRSLLLGSGAAVLLLLCGWCWPYPFATSPGKFMLTNREVFTQNTSI